jgi:hypothetical protein
VKLDERRRLRAAFHESGHAVASVTRGGYVRSIDLTARKKGKRDLQETDTDDQLADKAFVIWAGPWAQARWEDDCPPERVKAIFRTQSFFDWEFYEARFGNDVSYWAHLAENNKIRKLPPPKNLPPVTSPLPHWDAELEKVWPDIQHLAESLLRGDSHITLSNDRVLVRDGTRDYWSDDDKPNIVDDDSLPTVR